MKKYYLLATTALVASFCASRAMAGTSVTIPVAATINFPCKIEWNNNSVDFGEVYITELGSDGWAELRIDNRDGSVNFHNGSGSSTGSQLAKFSVSGGCNGAIVRLYTSAAGVGDNGDNGYFEPYIFGDAAEYETNSSTGIYTAGSDSEFYVGGVLSVKTNGESYINYHSEFILSLDY